MKPLRTTILLLPVLLPAALPAKKPYSRVIVIPPWSSNGFRSGRNSPETALTRQIYLDINFNKNQ